MGGVERTVAGDTAALSEGIMCGEVGVQFTGNVQFVEVELITVDGDIAVFSDHKLVGGDVTGEGLCAVEGDSTGVIVKQSVDSGIEIAVAVDGEVGTAVEVHGTGSFLAPHIGGTTGKNGAAGIQSEAVVVGQVQSISVDGDIGRIASGDFNTAAIEGGVFDDTEVVVDADTGFVAGVDTAHGSAVDTVDGIISGVAAEHSQIGSVGEGESAISDRHIGFEVTVVVEIDRTGELGEIIGIFDSGAIFDTDIVDVGEFSLGSADEVI